jgi:hypothetical protein
LPRYSKKYSKEIYFCIFVSFILFSMYFRSLNEFSVISIGKRKSENGENMGTVLGPLSAQGLSVLVQPNGHCSPESWHDVRAVTTTAATATPTTPLP